MNADTLLFRFIRFCIVGTSGMLIDFGITWLLKEKAGMNKYIANSFGFILAASSNYLLNRYWTFHSCDSQIVTQYFEFILVSLAGLGINSLIILLFSEKNRINFYLAKLFAIVVVMLWNFVINSLLTFR